MNNQLLPVKVSTLLVSKTSQFRTPLFSLWAVVSGSARITTFWGEFRVGALDVFSVMPNEEILMVPGDELVITQIEIMDSIARRAFQDSSAIFCNSALGMDCRTLHPMLFRLIETYYNTKGGQELLLAAKTYELLYYLQQNFSMSDTDTPGAGAGFDSRRYQIAQYLSLHYKEQLSLNSVAEHFHLTPQYFSKFFKKTFGTNFLTYLRDVRLNNATKALMADGSSVTGIAFEFGFPNPASFNKAFREKFGVTPRAFVERAENEALSAPLDSAIPLDRQNAISLLHGYTPLNLQELDEDVPEAGVVTGIYNVSVQSFRPMARTWDDIINVGRAENCLGNDFQMQFRAFAREVHPRYARMQNIISEEIFTSELVNGGLNFHRFDRLVEFFLSCGTKPMFELGPRPIRDPFSVTSQSVMNIKQLPSEVREQVQQRIISHCIDYWGVEEVSTWRFEMWLPQQAERSIREDAVERYFHTYETTFRTIKALAPQAEIGGMGININLEDTAKIRQILHMMQENRALAPDFVTLYAYPAYIGTMDDTYRTLNVDAILNADVQTTRDKVKYWSTLVRSVFPDCKVYIAEFSSDLTARFSVNESCNKGAFIADFVTNLFDQVDGMGYCLLSDLDYEPHSQMRPLFGGNGLISQDGLNKSGYWVFTLLSRLGRRLIYQDSRLLVTSRSENRYEILVHNHKNLSSAYCSQYFKRDDFEIRNEYFEDTDKLHLVLTLTGMKPGCYRVKKNSVNKFNNLLQGLHSLNDTRMLGREEYGYLRNICVPLQRLDYFDSDGTLKLELTLEADEVVLLMLTPHTEE